METLKEKITKSLDFFIKTGLPIANLGSSELRIVKSYKFGANLEIISNIVDTGYANNVASTTESYFDVLYNILNAFEFYYRKELQLNQYPDSFNFREVVSKWFVNNKPSINNISGVLRLPASLKSEIENAFDEYKFKVGKKELIYKNFADFISFWNKTFSSKFTTLEIKNQLRALGFYVTNDTLRIFIKEAVATGLIKVSTYGNSYNVYEILIGKVDANPDKTEVKQISANIAKTPFDSIDASKNVQFVNYRDAKKKMEKYFDDVTNFYNFKGEVVDAVQYVKEFHENSKSKYLGPFRDSLVAVIDSDYAYLPNTLQNLKNSKVISVEVAYTISVKKTYSPGYLTFVVDKEIFEFNNRNYSISDACRSVVSSIILNGYTMTTRTHKLK